MLYKCTEKKSYLRILKECYDKIPIDDMGKLKFVDPISRQTFDPDDEDNQIDIEQIKCGNGLKNLYHMDIKDPK